MSRGQRQKSALEVKRTFEPGRLSQVWLAEAYEHVVPRHVRIVRATAIQDETQYPDSQQRIGGQAG